MVTSKTLRAIGAGLALLVLLVAPPTLLITVIGNPWPAGGVALNAELSDGAIIGLLAVVVWVLWAQLLVCVIAETRAALAGRHSTVRVPATFGFQRDLARRLVTCVVVAAIASPVAGAVMNTASAATTGSSASTSATSATPTAGDRVGITARDGSSAALAGNQARRDALASTARGSSDAAAPASATGQTVTVHRGDDLWSIAERHLGDGSRWTEIRDLNEGQTMNGGRVFKAAEQIQPGWDLRMPAGADLGDQTEPPEKAQQDARGVEHRTVHAGDTLSEIALEETGDADNYPQLAAASDVVNPDHIEPGWSITIPDEQAAPDEDPSVGADGARAGDGGPVERPAARPYGPWHRAPAPERDSANEELDSRSQAPAAAEALRAAVAASTSAVSAVSGGSAEGVARSETAEDQAGAVWLVAGLAGGGGVLAGALFLAMRARRRAQFRARRPGRAIAVPGPDVASVEKTMIAVGSAAIEGVEFLDIALRRLAGQVAAKRGPMPAVAAVEVGEERVTLHLGAAGELPAPWEGSPDSTHWWCATSTPVEDLGSIDERVEPPYPLLVTIGTDAEGSRWLLNLEELGQVVVAGEEAAESFARHVAAQVCLQPWSAHVRLTCVGVAGELEGLGERVTCRDVAAAASGVADVLAETQRSVERAARYDIDTPTARTGTVEDDQWPASLLLVQRAAGDGGGLAEIRDLMNTQGARTATAVLVVDDQTSRDSAADEVVLRMASDGKLLVEQVGLTVTAVQLSSEEAAGCALLYSQSGDLEDVEVPCDMGAEGWERYADRAGSLRREHTVPRSTAEQEASRLLDQDDADTYLREGALAAEDLEVVAPAVPHTVREEVEQADPSLNEDLGDWLDPDSGRPKLTLMGPMTARTHGRPLVKQKPYCVELLAFLFFNRSRGATMEEICEAFSLNPGKAKDYLSTVRYWLGANPETGDMHLPDASRSPAALSRGVNVYQVDEGLLVDLELFRRLYLRGKARGGDAGHADLVSALGLIEGRPFDQPRKGGWSWLAENSERHDLYAEHAIEDVVLTVTAHALASGDLRQARETVELGVLATPHSESVRLCMVRLIEAEGDPERAEQVLRDEVCNRSDDDGPPPELSARTAAILEDHQWLAS